MSKHSCVDRLSTPPCGLEVSCFSGAAPAHSHVVMNRYRGCVSVYLTVMGLRS